MFGKNAISKYDPSTGDFLYVQEVFHTLQGEGMSAGRPAVFVRLAGCNLACYFCDTEFGDFSWTPSVKDELVPQIMELCEKHSTSLVVITGGEPMRQDITKLIKELVGQGIFVEIETSGSLWCASSPTSSRYKHDGATDALDAMEQLMYSGMVAITVSPKTPILHEKIRRYASAWKYIITLDGPVGDDGLPVSSTQRQSKPAILGRPPEGIAPHKVFLQPCDEYRDRHYPRLVKKTVDLCKQHGYRLSLQVHKVVGLE